MMSTGGRSLYLRPAGKDTEGTSTKLADNQGTRGQLQALGRFH